MTLKCIARVVRAKTPLADMAMFRVEEDKINTTNTMADPCEDHPVAWADMTKKHHHLCTCLPCPPTDRVAALAHQLVCHHQIPRRASRLDCIARAAHQALVGTCSCHMSFFISSMVSLGMVLPPLPLQTKCTIDERPSTMRYYVCHQYN